MHFDSLDKIYAMMKSNFYFDKVILTGPIGLCIPVRPVCTAVPILVVNICPLFFGKACMPKNTLLDQKCLRAMINNTSAIFVLRAIKNYRPCLALLQVDDETIYFGLQIFFMATGFVGSTSTCFSIDSYLCKCCSLLFWVWDKPERHHLGCKYFEFFFTSFSPSLLQLGSFSTRLLLIGPWEMLLGYI